jgi:hypothetical protein
MTKYRVPKQMNINSRADLVISKPQEISYGLL